MKVKDLVRLNAVLRNVLNGHLDCQAKLIVSFWELTGAVRQTVDLCAAIEEK